MANVHALIIDDNSGNVEVLAEMLTLENVSYTQLQDPLKIDGVLDQLQQLDVVFLDLEMPGLNGYQVLERFQSDPLFDGIPIVAYTVHVSEVNVARDLGFHSFLGKPLDVDVFPNQLARILQGERIWVA